MRDSGKGEARNRAIMRVKRTTARMKKGRGTKIETSARHKTIPRPCAEYVPWMIFLPLRFI
jgi:hypothetical protein